MALIDIKEGNVFVGVWFSEIKESGTDGDVMGVAWKEGGRGPWLFTYRFRYYVDKKTHDSDDEKSAWRVKMPAGWTETMVKAQVEEIFEHIQLKPDFVDLRGVTNLDEIVARLAAKPWTHFRPLMPKEKGQA